MTAAANDWTRARPGHWFSRAEAWLDARGKGAWIAAMILGFILFWPLGLALLAYMIWSKRLSGGSCRDASGARAGFHAMTPSGNSAFDAYKADTLRRLEEEQKSFHEFLQRLREARDKAEFDEFMEERARAARTGPDDADDAGSRDL